VSARSRLLDAAALATLVGAVAACSHPAPRAHAVEIRNFGFAPIEVTVERGDTVVWTNADFVPHTATSRAKRWDSGSIDANGSWPFVADSTGRYEYYCVFHPSMTATIIVR
jgi:plastocyanin